MPLTATVQRPPLDWTTYAMRLALLLAVGGVIRLLLAILLVHRSYDMDSVRIVDATLRSHFSLVYETRRWPYPGGLLPWVLASGWLSRLTGGDISIFFKLPSIAADLGIAWLVQAILGLRGASPARRLAGAALVSLGPSFIAISGYEGQVDGLAGLPALGALYAWERGRRGAAMPTRETAVALLLGLATAIKTILALPALAFLVRLRGWGRRGAFVALLAILPLLSVLPWLVAKPHSLSIILNYTGIGVGPLALAAEPSIARDFLTSHGSATFHGLSLTLQTHGKTILWVALGAAALLVLVCRPRPARAITLLWLCVYAFTPFFFFQYVLWGLPFFLAAGYLRQVALAQALLLVPTILWEARPWSSDWVIWPYVVGLTAAWAVAVVALILQVRAVYRRVEA